MEKMNNNKSEQLSALHLDSEIVHILSHSLYFFALFFLAELSHLKVCCSQHHTLPLKTAVECPKNDSLLHNLSFMIPAKKINNHNFI